MKLNKTASAVALALVTSVYSIPNMAAEEVAEDIENITVYGQKIERTLQETKESVSVITGAMIEKMPAVEFKDIIDITPNATNLADGESFILRGITQNSASTGGGDGALGTLYIDGVAYHRFSSRFVTKDLWDLAQIEILRGPQSTNVGRNALVGAMVIKTNRPELGENLAAVRLDAGNYGKAGISAMANLAVTDSSAFRFSGQYNEEDGYIENVTLDDDEYDARDNTNLRAQYYVEFSDDLTANLGVAYAKTTRGQDIYRADLQPVDSFNSSANVAANEEYEGLSASLFIDYKINDTFSLSSITSTLDGDYTRIDDDDEGPDGGNAFRGRTAEEQNWSQEFRLNYTSEKLSGVVGLFYTEDDLVNNTLGLVNIFPVDAGVPPELLPFYPEVVEVDVFTPFEQEVTNFAFFTEWDYQLTDKLTLSAGFRFDDEEQDSLSNNINTLAPGSELPDPVQSGLLAEQLFPGAGLGPVVEAGVTQVNGILLAQLTPTDFPRTDTSYDAFLPQIGITYDLNGQVSLSVFYKQGYRAGGTEVNLSGVSGEYDPEYLDNYEIALRSQWLDGALVFNANAYYGDWTDQQVSICEPGNIFNCLTENAGESEIYGAEFESQYYLSDDISLFASLGLAHTEFEEFVSDTDGDLSGNEFAFSPDMTAAVGARVYLSDHFYVSGNVNYQDDMYSDQQNQLPLESRTLVNLQAAYEFENFEVEAYVNNLTDKFYKHSDFVQVDQQDQVISRVIRGGAPREFGIAVTYRFE